VLQASILDGGSFDPFSFDQNGLAPPEVDVKSHLSQPSLWSRQNVDNPAPQEREATRQRLCKGLDRALSSPLSSIFD
jgi:hypothetical protein